VDPLKDYIETSVVIGEDRVDQPLRLRAPVMIGAMSFGHVSGMARAAFARGAALSGTVSNAGEGGILEEEIEALAGFDLRSMVQWSPSRFGMDVNILDSISGIEIKLGQGGSGAIGDLYPGSRNSQRVASARKVPEGADLAGPSRHMDMESIKDLAKHVEMLKEATDYTIPVLVKLGAAHVHSEVKTALRAGADAIVVDAGTRLYGNPYIGNLPGAGIPPISIFAPAKAAFREFGAKKKGVKLFVAGGFATGTDIYKALALGADGVVLGTAAKIAIGCPLKPSCYEGQCPSGVCTSDPDLEVVLDWRKGAKGLSRYLNSLIEELRYLCAMTGHKDVKNIATDDLRALSYDCAAITGTKLAGYERSLPMWDH